MRKILPAFLSCQGLTLTEAEKKLFAQYNPLGVCLFAKYCNNIQDNAQLSALTREIKEVIGRDDVLIAVDQEGGRVRRLLEPEFTAVTAAENLNTTELVKAHAYHISHDLKNSGINVNFAPVLDIMQPETSNVLAGRCFPKEHGRFGFVMVHEYISHGICPCIKHLPGHGRTKADPHLTLPIIDADLATLQSDFAPFKATADAPMGMAAHILLQAVDAENPVTFSAKAIQQTIRQEIGFNGFLVSDAIVMQALSGTIADRTRRALAAGCDAVCLGNADFAANEALCQSGAELTDEAAERLKKIKQIIDKTDKFSDYEKIKNNYCAMLKNIISYDYHYDATEVLNRLRKQ